MQPVRSGQSVHKIFTLRRFDTGNASDADTLPTGILYLNGDATEVDVTISNISTGRYEVSAEMPTLDIDDVVEIVVSATVNSVTDSGVVWSGYTAGIFPRYTDEPLSFETPVTAFSAPQMPAYRPKTYKKPDRPKSAVIPKSTARLDTYSPPELSKPKSVRRMGSPIFPRRA